ncbi:hypothetical protein KJ854_06030 [Patescibacteria group bacterium]|nr:hypothetical protein [Patescibacteria group bacterium]MBU4142118.1 hypothetical protein [Patescibacteria group bacterium]
MEDKSFLLIIAAPGVLVFLALFNFIGNGGAFGLNPMTNDCIGRKIDIEYIKKYFPIGEAALKTPVHIRYLVPEKTEVKTFCLGQNMRY